MTASIFLGTDVSTKKGLFISQRELRHLHIRGMTGSGKTSLGILPLYAQLLEPYDDGCTTCRDPIFVFDLGGDVSLFHNAKLLAEEKSRTFRFLTLDPDLASDFFPPFQAVPSSERNALRLAEMLVTALHMDNGLAYGGTYYSQQNTAALLSVARRLTDESQAATLEDVAAYLEDPQNRRLFKDADQVRMTFQFLREYPQLSDAPDSTLEINFERAIEQNEVIYFFTPTLAEPQTARLVAGLGLFSAVNAAMHRTKHGTKRKRIRIFIDEFQEIVGRNAAALLAQGRKFGISTLCLANQSTSQLETRDSSLADAIFEGTAAKIYYTCVGKRDIDDLQSLSKDKIKILRGSSTQRFAQTQTEHPVIVPSLERDTILDVSSTFGQAFVVLNDGKGHKEPIMVQQTHTMPDLSDVPMPLRVKPVAAREAESPLAARKPDPDKANREEGLRRLLAEKMRAEQWRDGSE